MELEYGKPFRNQHGEVVTMKSIRTIHDRVDIQVNENKTNYLPADLTPITHEEYQDYLDDEELE